MNAVLSENVSCSKGRAGNLAHFDRLSAIKKLKAEAISAVSSIK
jgi:hypothetical protein